MGEETDNRPKLYSKPCLSDLFGGYVFLKATYKCIAGFWQMKLCCAYFKALDDDKQLFSTSSMPSGVKNPELDTAPAKQF